MQKRGWFISIEGVDGAGKTTLIEQLLKHLRAEYPVVSIREPGGTVVSEKIRELLLDVRSEGMRAKTEALLYGAARSQVTEEIIAPALAEGKVVIADRFADSTIAYQGYGRGLDIDFLKGLNRLCTAGNNPDLTILLDIDPEEGQKRRTGHKPDRLEKEGLEFQQRVRRGYLELQAEEPSRIKLIDANLSQGEILSRALQIIKNRLLMG